MFRLNCARQGLGRLVSVRTHRLVYSTNSNGMSDIGSADYLDSLYADKNRDPSWNRFFNNISTDIHKGIVHMKAISINGDDSHIMLNQRAQLLVRAHQVSGHLRSDLDPLKIMQQERDWGMYAPELDPESYGLTEEDLNSNVQLGDAILPIWAAATGETSITLKELLCRLKKIYCGSIGFEYTHNSSREKCNWLRQKIEAPRKHLSDDVRRRALERVMRADRLEAFFNAKYPSEKRFSMEGGEGLIPGLLAALDTASSLGVEQVVFGMSHRGRLNVLANVLGLPLEDVFRLFGHHHDTFDVSKPLGALDYLINSGDVKYHLGCEGVHKTPDGSEIKISMLNNPSHLEAINTVVLGRARAMQHHLTYGRRDYNIRQCDDDPVPPTNIEALSKIMPILIHGDAAFAGQGVVYETLGMNGLPGYNVGGTIHIVVNNQIGFTTDPRFARSTPYCTDVARSGPGSNAPPIFHVNGHDLDAVHRAFTLAAEWRAKWQSDVVVDLVCFRKHGHNEVDNPAFTQPRMFKAIQSTAPVVCVYSEELIKDGVIKESEIDVMRGEADTELKHKYEASNAPVIQSPKSNIVPLVLKRESTGLSLESLQVLGKIVSNGPTDRSFNIHKGLQKVLQNRWQTIESGTGIDMATAEALAYGSLLNEGVSVRITGQDVERGTFSQRHAVLHDQNDERQFVPLSTVKSSSKQHNSTFTICNSPLSEFGVLGFELGYSLPSSDNAEGKRKLVIWEAQFGDFSNNAQCIIDQFLVSGERKWAQRTGLTLLLPHGYDGAGPEHSNARLERWLSLCDDNILKANQVELPGFDLQEIKANIQVAMPSTPANYFHLLRRQVTGRILDGAGPLLKPLIVLTSKSLLRHPSARSGLAEMGPGTEFKPIIADEPSKQTSRVILCSGQNKYLLSLISTELRRLRKSGGPITVIWAQEEPQNLGAWYYVRSRIESVLASINCTSNATFDPRVRYSGREATGAVATGLKDRHLQEEAELIARALGHEVSEANLEAIFRSHDGGFSSPSS